MYIRVSLFAWKKCTIMGGGGGKNSKLTTGNAQEGGKVNLSTILQKLKYEKYSASWYFQIMWCNHIVIVITIYNMTYQIFQSSNTEKSERGCRYKLWRNLSYPPPRPLYFPTLEENTATTANSITLKLNTVSYFFPFE